MNLNAITEREKDLLLTHFFHYLPQDGNASAGRNSRQEIGKEYPGIYNRLMEMEIVTSEFQHERDAAIVAAYERGAKDAILGTL